MKSLAKFVVALNAEGRQRQLRAELLRVLTEDPRVSIVEGAGRNAVTVLMTEQVCAELRKKVSYATVAPLQSLQLLT